MSEGSRRPAPGSTIGGAAGAGSRSETGAELEVVAELQRLLAGDDAFVAARRRLLDAAGIDAGDRVLEVGCGVFAASPALARRLGPSGRLVGLDGSPELLARAVAKGGASGEERPARGGSGSGLMVALLAGDAHRLPFPDGVFDVVLYDRVLAHLSDPEAALREADRVLVGGGRVGAFDWSLEATRVSCRLPGFEEAYRELVRRQAPRPGVAGALSGWLVDAGLEEVSAIPVPLATPRLGPAWRRLLEDDLVAAVESGLADGAMADEWLADILELDRRGAFVALIPATVATGMTRRPT